MLDDQSAWDLHDSVGAGVGGPLRKRLGSVKKGYI